MTPLFKRPSVLCLLFFALSVGLALPGSAAKKTTYPSRFFLPEQQFEVDGFCGNLSGTVGAGDFFTGLERIETNQAVEFRKKSQIVRVFPDELYVNLAGTIGSCPNSLPNTLSTEALDDFANGLKITTQWVDGNAGQSIANVSVAKILPSTRWWTENPNELPQWAFRIKVPSKDIAISDALVISLLSEDGHKIINFTFLL
jgi:hypothetical protein